MELEAWELTGLYEYRYTVKDFLDIPEGPFRENAEKLSAVDGALCFAIGFLTIGMKKIGEA